MIGHVFYGYEVYDVVVISTCVVGFARSFHR